MVFVPNFDPFLVLLKFLDQCSSVISSWDSGFSYVVLILLIASILRLGQFSQSSMCSCVPRLLRHVASFDTWNIGATDWLGGINWGSEDGVGNLIDLLVIGVGVSPCDVFKRSLHGIADCSFVLNNTYKLIIWCQNKVKRHLIIFINCGLILQH